MFNSKFTINKTNYFFSFFIVFNLIILNFANPVVAEKKTNNNQKDNSNYGLPIYRRDGGSRGEQCVVNQENSNSQKNHNLVALIPDRSIGINASASPELFFYVPEIHHPKTLEFVLRNEQDELIYETFLTTKGKGVMSVAIPPKLKSNKLEPEQNYHWYLSMICNSRQRSRDIVVEGWMRQGEVDSAIEQELNTADSVAQAEIYHEQGFWYDALAVLANDNAKQSVAQEKWSELLESVGLEDFADAQFIKTESVESAPSAR